MVDGNRCDLTSSLKMLRPEQIWQPRMGAPLGNRNRLRHGNETRAMKELRRLMAQWRRETALLLARAACELASSSPVYGEGDRRANHARACSRNRRGKGRRLPRPLRLALSRSPPPPLRRGGIIHNLALVQSCIVRSPR